MEARRLEATIFNHRAVLRNRVFWFAHVARCRVSGLDGAGDALVAFLTIEIVRKKACCSFAFSHHLFSAGCDDA